MGDKKKNIFQQTRTIRNKFRTECDHYVISKPIFSHLEERCKTISLASGRKIYQLDSFMKKHFLEK